MYRSLSRSAFGVPTMKALNSRFASLLRDVFAERLREVRAEHDFLVLPARFRSRHHHAAAATQRTDERTARAGSHDNRDVAFGERVQPARDLGRRNVGPGDVEARVTTLRTAMPHHYDQHLVTRLAATSEFLQRLHDRRLV